MKARAVLATVAILVATLTACGKSEAEQQADCQKALTAEATKSNRPEPCEPLSQDVYTTLLMAYTLENTIGDMSEKDQDLLDYGDDGELNDSIIGTDK
jgi:hypothetical protein